MVGLKIKKEKILFAGVARPPKCLNDPNFSECFELYYHTTWWNIVIIWSGLDGVRE